MERVTRIAEAGSHVGGVVSHLTAFELAARALAAPGDEAGSGEVRVSELPPATLSEIVSILYRIETRIDLDHYLDFDGSSARLRIFVKSPDYRRGRALERYLRRELDRVLAVPVPGGPVRYHLSGDLPVAGAVVGAIVTNMLRSIGWTVLGVLLLLALVLRSLRSAVVALVPLLCGLAILLGALGYAAIPLGIANSMFLAVTIGVGVDFGLHFRHAYRRGRGSGLARGPALAAMMASVGRAVRWNAAVLACGLSVLALSDLKPDRSLGILLAASMVTCYGTTLLLLPWLLGRWEGRSVAGARWPAGQPTVP
jgi:predicted RND superfamily exporter protein